MKPFYLIEGIEVRWADAYMTRNGDGESFTQPVLVEHRQNSNIKTHRDNTVVLTPLLESIKEHLPDFQGHKQVTFVYYVTSEPKTLEECSSQLAAITLGMPKVDWFHHYSDLTGYLYTSIDFKATDAMGRGHDLEQELEESINKLSVYDWKKGQYTSRAYLTLEIRAH